MPHSFRRLRRLIAFALAIIISAAPVARAARHVFSVRGEQVLLNGQPFKVIGLRCSNALISDATAQDLIGQLDGYKAQGVNTVSVYLMGSRFGDVQGYRPDASLDPVLAARLGRIIEAADARGMVVLVGCFYWSTSRANEALGAWKQAEANRAVANTIAWLKEKNYRNVFVDPDNEGMAHRGAGFDLAAMIEAGHAADPAIAIAWNDKSEPSPKADLIIHHGPQKKGRPWIQSEGSPANAPGGYWGSYSKQQGLYNYLNIGVYTPEMKEDIFKQTREGVDRRAGFMLASTWLQCVAPHGPNAAPGGDGSREAPGVAWWLEFVARTYGPWTPPAAEAKPATAKNKAAKNVAAKPKAKSTARAAEPLPQTAQGQFYDILVKSPKAYADPWHEVTCWVNLVRPDGSRVNDCRGFYEDGNWRIRVLPDQPGRWRWGLHFSDIPANATAGSGGFECTPAVVAPGGQLVQLAGNPIWFGLPGGRPILLRSLHVGDRFFAENWPDEKRKAFLDWAQAQGYNMLSVGSCLLNRREAGRGEGWQTPELWNPEARRPNPKEFDKLEVLLADLMRRGIYVHPFSGFFGQKSNFPQAPEDQENYLRYTVARLGPCWNLLFNVAGPEPLSPGHAKDFYGKMGAGEIVRLGLLIQSMDSYGHLIAVHNPPGDDPFARSGWSTYVTLQGWKDRDWQRIYEGMLRNHADKPLLAHEVLWPGNTLGHGEFTDAEIRKKAWVLLMAAATINFGDMAGNSSSGFSGTMELSDKIQKRHDIMKQAWDLFGTFPFYRMRPRPDLVRGGFCLAEAGSQYLVYLPEGGETKIELEGGPYKAQWINPSRPEERKMAEAKDGSYQAPDAGDWLLEIK